MKIWKSPESDADDWQPFGELDPAKGVAKGAGEAWALALSETGQYLATTTYDGRINVWDIMGESPEKIQEYETGNAGSGTYGLCVDLSRDGKYTASGHQGGSVYVYNNDTGRLQYSLPGGLIPRASWHAGILGG